YAQMDASQPEPDDATHKRQRYIHQHEQRVGGRIEGHEKQGKNQRDRDGQDHGQPPPCTVEILELAAPFDAISARQLNASLETLPGVGHEAALVAPPNVRPYRDLSLVLASGG